MQISLLNVIFGRCTAETLVTLDISVLQIFLPYYFQRGQTFCEVTPEVFYPNFWGNFKVASLYCYFDGNASSNALLIAILMSSASVDP